MHRRLRLRFTSDFQRLRQIGKVQRHFALNMSYLPNDLPHNRYGFVTPKRLGNAVNRNRLRRQTREAVRLLHPDMLQGYDIVFIVRPALAGQPFPKIQRIVYGLCQSAGLVSEEL